MGETPPLLPWKQYVLNWHLLLGICFVYSPEPAPKRSQRVLFFVNSAMFALVVTSFLKLVGIGTGLDNTGRQRLEVGWYVFQLFFIGIGTLIFSWFCLWLLNSRARTMTEKAQWCCYVTATLVSLALAFGLLIAVAIYFYDARRRDIAGFVVSDWLLVQLTQQFTQFGTLSGWYLLDKWQAARAEQPPRKIAQVA
jgi:hypothetical protein